MKRVRNLLMVVVIFTSVTVLPIETQVDRSKMFLNAIKTAANSAIENPFAAAKNTLEGQFLARLNSELAWVQETTPEKIDKLKGYIIDFDKAMQKGQNLAIKDAPTIEKGYNALITYIDAILKDLAQYNEKKLAQIKEQSAHKASSSSDIKTQSETKAQEEALKMFAKRKQDRELEEIKLEQNVINAIKAGDLPRIKTLIPAKIKADHLLRQYKFSKTPRNLAKELNKPAITLYFDSLQKAKPMAPGRMMPSSGVSD